MEAALELGGWGIFETPDGTVVFCRVVQPWEDQAESIVGPACGLSPTWVFLCSWF